ncbi:hypothetical protein C7C46_18345 [Streptomyces tateyamensis]|uniref:Uncharacterized protein n=1 Tax=Streptomyces tateyamensis TaxID=565073 RepID=A0A2V4N7X5_9ACTN|nr:hypothetical protein [Streptomyces tateyamensis]PYC77596.1 hypothetical protein C7C46_18345 [Streptomyces tateyamensis]
MSAMRVIHEMRPVGKLATGAEEWACPSCGRRVALAGPPRPGLTVLEPGDESVVHVGLSEPATAVTNPGEPYGLGPIEEIPRPPGLPMLPLDTADTAARDRAWLAEIGIDWDGDEAA